MDQTVAAVIGGEDDDDVGRQGSEQPAQGLVGAAQAGQVAGRHPALRMAKEVGIGEMREEQTEAGLGLHAGLVGHALVAVRHERVAINCARHVEVGELLLACDHDGFKAGSMRQGKQRGDLDRSEAGAVIVPGQPVHGGHHPREHGGVRGQRGGRHDRPSRPGIGAAPSQDLQIGHVRLLGGVGAQPIDRDEHHARRPCWAGRQRRRVRGGGRA